MIFSVRLIFIILLLLPTNIFAEKISGKPLRLSLYQAVSLALDNNSDLTLSRNRVQSANVNIEAASSKFLPSLQAQASGHQNYRLQTAPGETENYRNANLQLSAGINLFNGFADRAGFDAAHRQQQGAAASLQRERQVVTFSVINNYISVLMSQELVQVAVQNLKSQRDLEQQIHAFFDAGSRSITDYYQQQAATAQAEFDLADVQRNLQIAKLEFLQVLGYTLPIEIELLSLDSDWLSIELENLDSTQATHQALKSRPDLLAQQRLIEAAQQQTRAAQAGFLPSLDLQASSGTNYSSVSNGSFHDQFDDNQAANLGLILTIPIFDRNQTRTNVALAKISESNALTTKIKLQQQVALEVGQALANYQRSKLQLATTERQLNYARQALAANEARYQVGAATWVELSTVQTNFIQSQADEVRARYGVLLQGLNIGYSRGDLETLLQALSEQETSS